MIAQILRNLPVRISNFLLARIILKSKIKNDTTNYLNVPLRYNKKVKLDLNLSDIGHQYLAFTGVYEYDLTKIIYNLSKKCNGLMIDVGANYGYYSILWSSEHINNKAIAFEASPRNIEAITNNIKINALTNQIKLEELAVSDHKGVVTFNLGPEDQTGWGGISNDAFNKNLVNVNSVSLDSYFEDILTTQIEILKIDTEGADYLVLKGAENLLKNKKIKHIFWEENTFRSNLLGLKPYQSIPYLEEMNYLIKKIGDNEYYATIK